MSSSTIDDALGEEIQPSTCSDLVIEERQAEFCFRTFESGLTSLVLTSSASKATLIIDIGGPVAPIDDIQAAMRDIAAIDSAGTYDLIAISVPLPAAILKECRDAAQDRIDVACGLSEIESMYTTDYFEALRTELESAGVSRSSLQLLGASYAASRWYRIDLETDDPVFTIDRSVFVSPLLPGTDVVELTTDTLSVAQRLFEHGLDGDCWTSECLSSLDLTESCPNCDLVARLESLTGLPQSHIQAGLAGLAPLVERNGPLIAAALEVGDEQRTTDLLSRGRESFLGLSVRSGLHVDAIHLLAVTCPILSGEVKLAGPPYSSCTSVGSMDRLDIEDADSSSSILRNACFLSTQPDPVLGLATTRGAIFGDGAGFLLQDNSLGHGDLATGFEVLKRDNTARICPTNS